MSIIEQRTSKSKIAGSGGAHHTVDAETYRGPVAYVDMHGYFDNAKRNNPFQLFCNKIAKEGKTYAQAQKEETIFLIKTNKIGCK